VSEGGDVSPPPCTARLFSALICFCFFAVSSSRRLRGVLGVLCAALFVGRLICFPHPTATVAVFFFFFMAIPVTLLSTH
jgi:uncharacterized membrane protein